MNHFYPVGGDCKARKHLLNSLQPLLTFADSGLTYFMRQVIKFSQQFCLTNREFFCNNADVKCFQTFQKDLSQSIFTIIYPNSLPWYGIFSLLVSMFGFHVLDLDPVYAVKEECPSSLSLIIPPTCIGGL